MANTISINEITLTVKGQRLILTVEEIKALRQELDTLLGNTTITYLPNPVISSPINYTGPTC